MKIKLIFFLLLISNLISAQDYYFTPLLVAVKENNVSKMKELITNGEKIEQIISNQNDTPLDYAIKFNHQIAAQYLIENGAKSRRYIYDAVKTGDINWVNYLLERGFFDDELVMAAVESGNLEMVQFFIRKGYKVDFIQKQRSGIFKKRFASPIEVAIANENSAITLELAQNGGNLNKAFEYFFYTHDYDRCKLLIDNLNTRKVPIEPYFLSSFASYNLILPQLFVDRGVKVDCVNDKGYNALQISLKNGDKNGVNYCLNTLKLDINTQTKQNETSLMLACMSRDSAFIHWALDTLQYDINAVDKEGKSVLFYAVDARMPGIVDFVLKKNPNINVQNSAGETVMMLLLKRNELDIYKKIWMNYRDQINFKLKNKENCDLLGYFTAYYPQFWASINAYIRLGCDPNLDNMNGENLAFLLANNNDLNGLKELQKIGVSLIPHNRSNEAPTNASFECVKFLLENGEDVNKKSSGRYFSYLEKAVADNQTEQVQHLLEKGANLKQERNEGTDHLFQAIRTNNVELVRLLLSREVNLKNTNIHHQTPLDFAIENNRNEIIELLHSAGAKTRLETEEKEKALLSAIGRLKIAIMEKNYVEIKQILNTNPELPLDNYNSTVIYKFAVDSSDYTMLDFLFSKQIDPNLLLDEEKRTALHFAAFYNNEKLVRYLIGKGVNPNQKDKMRAYPFRYAKNKTLKAYLKSLVIQ